MAKMGRPPKPADEKRDVSMTFRVTRELREKLDAAKEDRTLSAEIELRLRRSFEIDPSLEKHFGKARVTQVAGILEDVQRIESLARARWYESRFVWDEIKAFLESFFAGYPMPGGERLVPDSLVELYAQFPPGFLGQSIALQRRAQLNAKPGAWEPRHPRYVDPAALRIAHAGKIAPPKKRRTK